MQCANCGAHIDERAKFCVQCGTLVVADPAVSAKLEPVIAEASPPPVQLATQQVAPKAEASPDWHPDPTGRHEYRYWDGSAWTEHVSDDGERTVDPVSKAPVQVQTGSLPSMPCPRCGSGMVWRVKRSGFGLALIIIGIVLTPVIIGIPIWILGMVVRHGNNGQMYLLCPYCQYSSAPQPGAARVGM